MPAPEGGAVVPRDHETVPQEVHCRCGIERDPV